MVTYFLPVTLSYRSKNLMMMSVSASSCEWTPSKLLQPLLTVGSVPSAHTTLEPWEAFWELLHKISDISCVDNKSMQFSAILTRANHDIMSLQHLDFLLKCLVKKRVSEGDLICCHNKINRLQCFPCSWINLFQGVHLSKIDWHEWSIIYAIVREEVLYLNL